MQSFQEQSRPALARGVRLQTDARTDQPVLLFPEGVVHLSASAYDIVARCDGQTPIHTIISTLAQEYEAPPDALRQDVLECLHQLHERKLLVFSQ
jgi:pyrroloquinoline quinone biosynthesis protein D